MNRILVVDNNADHVALYVRTLGRQFGVNYLRADSIMEICEVAKFVRSHEDLRLVLVDWNATDAKKVVEEIQQLPDFTPPPIVMMAEVRNREQEWQVRSRAHEIGADDLLRLPILPEDWPFVVDNFIVRLARTKDRPTITSGPECRITVDIDRAIEREPIFIIIDEVGPKFSTILERYGACTFDTTRESLAAVLSQWGAMDPQQRIARAAEIIREHERQRFEGMSATLYDLANAYVVRQIGQRGDRRRSS